ncbi:helix-turn-helix transcriptional regulator [Curvibacter fontanus]
MKDSAIQKRSSTLLRAPQVLERLNISRATLYRGIRAGYYPKPVLIGERAVRWRSADIEILIDRGIQ